MIDTDTRELLADPEQVLVGSENIGGWMKARISTVMMVAVWLGLFALWLMVKPA